MKTSEYKYGKYPFEKFNILQDLVFPYVDDTWNVIVSAPTSSGKTIAGELLAGKCLKEKKRVIYTSPLKALAEERADDWSNSSHPWSKKKLIILTGDYQLTPEREKQLDLARIIITTYEMLAVRARRSAIEKHKWVEEAGALIVDEAHFLSSDGRGDHLENALIGFTRMNPTARIIFLSATMRNHGQIVDWLTKLNGHPTQVIESDYRPCALTTHFETYPGQTGWGTYDAQEDAKVTRLLGLLEEHTDDQWLIFVHSKAMGYRVRDRMAERGMSAAFHNADLSKEKRSEVEKAYKAKKLQYLIATSTLAYGVNLPARRVAIVGVTRGMDMVDILDLIQECGRAGRPRYDTVGDAHIIVDEARYGMIAPLIANGVDVVSQLPKHVGFHLIGEIAEKRVDSPDASATWADKTLAAHQGLWNPTLVRSVFNQFESRKLIRKQVLVKDAMYEATTLGKIASMHYFDPIDVADWMANMTTVKQRELTREPIALAWMWGNVSSRQGFIPKDMRALTSEYIVTLRSFGLSTRNDGCTAISAVLWQKMIGREERIKAWPQIVMPLNLDGARVISCLKQIDDRVLRGRNRRYWDMVWARVRYGVGWDAASLCTIPGIGPSFAAVLVADGVCSPEEFFKKKALVRGLLPAHVYKEAIRAESDFVRDEPDPIDDGE